MDKIRKPFQGLLNIIRFNWHFYFLSTILIAVLFVLTKCMGGVMNEISFAFIILITASILISLIVSFYIYDLSDLYKLTWLDKIHFHENEKIANINAGFDETSSLLKNKFSHSQLFVFDFYNPQKHTEVSIKRARKAYPPFPGTEQISTDNLPLKNNLIDNFFVIFAAHEIRVDKERIVFFKELYRVLAPQGRIILTEHLRNTVNLLAYNVGFFHFYSKKSWNKIFQCSGFRVEREIKITPFITTFILEKNGSAS